MAKESVSRVGNKSYLSWWFGWNVIRSGRGTAKELRAVRALVWLHLGDCSTASTFVNDPIERVLGRVIEFAPQTAPNISIQLIFKLDAY